MLKALTNPVRHAITRYQARHLKQVVTTYTDHRFELLAQFLPVLHKMYRDAAHAVVEKTNENPDIALQLVNAIELTINHYAPALKPVFTTYIAEIDKIDGLEVVRWKHAAFIAARNELMKS